MLEMIMYTFIDKNWDKNIVIQVSEEEVIVYNSFKKDVNSFDYNVDLYEYMCRNIDFKYETIHVNKDFKDTHLENIKILLNDLDRETIYHLLNDITYD